MNLSNVIFFGAVVVAMTCSADAWMDRKSVGCEYGNALDMNDLGEVDGRQLVKRNTVRDHSPCNDESFQEKDSPNRIGTSGAFDPVDSHDGNHHHLNGVMHPSNNHNNGHEFSTNGEFNEDEKQVNNNDIDGEIMKQAATWNIHII